MTDERYKIMREDWYKLKKFLLEVEFNDTDYKMMFDTVNTDAIFHFCFLTQCNAIKNEFNDISYVEQVKSILDTIDTKQTISYKQFRVLCFFYKRVQYRKNNPIKLQPKNLES